MTMDEESATFKITAQGWIQELHCLVKSIGRQSALENILTALRDVSDRAETLFGSLPTLEGDAYDSALTEFLSLENLRFKLAIQRSHILDYPAFDQNELATHAQPVGIQ